MIENTHQRPLLIYRRVEGGISRRRNPGEHFPGLSLARRGFSAAVHELRITSHKSRRLHFLGESYRGAGHVPIHAQRAAAGGRVVRDREVFHLRRERRDLHVRAEQVELVAGIRNAPLAGFLADDERPCLISVRDREDRVVARRHDLAANGEVCGGDERSRFVRARAPWLAVRVLPADYLSPLEPRARIIRGDAFAVRQRAYSFGRRAGTLALVLLASQTGKCEYRNCYNKRCTASEFLSHLVFSSVVFEEVEVTESSRPHGREANSTTSAPRRRLEAQISQILEIDSH